MKNVIRVHDLNKTFGSVTAVSGLSLEVDRGEIFGIIGPDGAGKTTLLRMLAGVMVPTSGAAEVLGLKLPGQAEAVKEHIGYMSQKFNLYPDLTVEENIHFFSGIFLIDDATLQQRLEPLLRMTRLAAFQKRLAGDLSGGMKQKLALICTLIHRPQLLLLDEPTTGVDPLSRREFWEILHEILKEGVTIVISTPYMDEAEWCTRIGLMFKGKFISCGTPKELKDSMTGVVAELIPKKGKANLDPILKGAEGITDIQVLGDKYHLVIRTEADADALKKKAASAAEFRAMPASIEDVFVSRIKQ